MKMLVLLELKLMGICCRCGGGDHGGGGGGSEDLVDVVAEYPVDTEVILAVDVSSLLCSSSS